MGSVVFKWVQLGADGSGWLKMVQNGSKEVQNGPNWSKMYFKGLNRSKQVTTDPNWPNMMKKSNMVEIFQNGPTSPKII